MPDQAYVFLSRSLVNASNMVSEIGGMQLFAVAKSLAGDWMTEVTWANIVTISVASNNTPPYFGVNASYPIPSLPALTIPVYPEVTYDMIVAFAASLGGVFDAQDAPAGATLSGSMSLGRECPPCAVCALVVAFQPQPCRPLPNPQ